MPSHFPPISFINTVVAAGWGEVLDPAAVREAKQMIARYGFREIKRKGGVLTPDVEILTIQALRQAFGDSYPLRIDPNCAWSVARGRGLRGRCRCDCRLAHRLVSVLAR
jgi:L-alanine-DL-glutamate epimerase-like enolase superfamily enzyme